MNKLARLWIDLKFEFWLLPATLIFALGLFAFGLVEFDHHFDDKLRAIVWLKHVTSGPTGANAILSIISGSMITVASIVFSITVLALAQTSIQFTPRILRHFMTDRITQTVLGTVIGIFTYCLVVLRTIRSGDFSAAEFVPTVSIGVSILLALVGISFLVFFLGYIAHIMQPSTIIADITQETMKLSKNLFPKLLDKAENTENIHLPSVKNWQSIPALKTGYIRHTIVNGLSRFAHKYNTLVRMDHHIGAFILAGASLVSLASEKKPDAKMIKALNNIYVIDSHRTIHQDIGFGIQQLVDMTLKSLTAGANDITTAVSCVDYISVILADLAQRQISTSYIYDHQQQLRVISENPRFEKLLSIAFDQIRQNATGNVTIIIRLLHSLKTIAHHTENPQRRKELLHHVHLITAVAERSIVDREDLHAAEEKAGKHGSYWGNCVANKLVLPHLYSGTKTIVGVMPAKAGISKKS